MTPRISGEDNHRDGKHDPDPNRPHLYVQTRIYPRSDHARPWSASSYRSAISYWKKIPTQHDRIGMLSTISCRSLTSFVNVGLFILGLLGWPIVGRADGTVPCGRFTNDEPAAPAPREGHWPLQQFDKIKAKVQSHSYRVLFLGDSLTQRWDPVTWSTYFSRIDALNAGVDGDRTEHLLWRIENENLENQRPRVVVLLIGTNDLGHRRSPAEAAEGIRRILQKLRERLPEAQILLEALWPRSDLDRLNDEITPVNHRIQKCEDHHDITYVDPGRYLLDFRGRLNRAFTVDGVHLNQAGYQIVSPKIAVALTVALGKR